MSNSENRRRALLAAIARCQNRMRAAKRRGDMLTYHSYRKQVLALKNQLRASIQKI